MEKNNKLLKSDNNIINKKYNKVKIINLIFLHGMSAEATMLQVKGWTKDDRGESQSQRAQAKGKGDQ